MQTAGIFNDTSVSGHYGCTAVMGTILRELAARRVMPASLWPVAEMTPRLGRWKRLRQRASRLFHREPLVRAWRPRSDADAFVRRLAGCELVVTGRFHSVLLAILTDTPFLALASNTRKVEAVLADVFGTTDRLVTPDALADPGFADSLRRGRPFTEAEQAALARYRTAAATARQTLFDALAEDPSR